MKRFYLVASAALVALMLFSCKKDEAAPSEDALPTPQNVEPAQTVLPTDAQQSRIDKAGEDLVRQVDPAVLSELRTQVMDMTEAAGKYEEGPALNRLAEALESMTHLNGDITDHIYSLSTLRGHYDLVNGTQNYSDAGNLVFNVENEWYITADFSEEMTRVLVSEDVLVDDYPYYATKSSTVTDMYYVEVPAHTSIVFRRKDNVIASLSADFNIENLNIVEGPSNSLVAIVSAVLNVAGYEIGIVKSGFDKQSASVRSYISRNGVVLINEEVFLNDIVIPDSEPTTAGRATVSLNVMGMVQGKAEISSVGKFIELSEELDEYRSNEDSYKSVLNQMNGLMDNGIYFSSDVKQCSFELYPTRDMTTGLWTYGVRVMFPDGSSSVVLEEFFSEKYFGNLIQMIGELVEEIDSIINGSEPIAPESAL